MCAKCCQALTGTRQIVYDLHDRIEPGDAGLHGTRGGGQKYGQNRRYREAEESASQRNEIIL